MKALDFINQLADGRPPKKPTTHASSLPQKAVNPAVIGYFNRNRGNWHKGEYTSNFATIQQAQNTDSFIARSITKKVQRFMVAGWELHSLDDEAVNYVHRRISEIELVSNTPWPCLMESSVYDVARYNNCYLHKIRSQESSSGKVRVDLYGSELKPVAAYEPLPAETLRYVRNKKGVITKLKQEIRPGEESKEFSPKDIVHIYTNKQPGFSQGTPILNTVLDDVALLRRIEENVEELIETSLFPILHYTVGTDAMPEVRTPEGYLESELIKRNIEMMPPGAAYISNHRHKIEVIGNEGKSLKIDTYLNYFKLRVYAGLGVAGVDFGEADSAGKTAAGTLSKNLIQEVESLQQTMKVFIEKFIFEELLLEGGFDPITNPDHKVHIKFGIVDRGEASALENQVSQLWLGNLLTVDEARVKLGLNPYTEEQLKRTHHAMFAEPLAMISGMAPGATASHALGEIPTSNVDPSQVKKAEQFAEKQAKEAAKAKAAVAVKRPGKPSGTARSGAAASSANKARPANQHGRRAGAKTTKDDLMDTLSIYCQENNLSFEDLGGDMLESILVCIQDRINRFDVDPETAVVSVAPRIKKLVKRLE